MVGSTVGRLSVAGLLAVLLFGCGGGEDGLVVDITNSSQQTIEVSIDVEGVPGKIACIDDVCGPIDDPAVELFVQTLGPGQTLSHSVPVRTNETGFDSVLDNVTVTIETDHDGTRRARTLTSVGAENARSNFEEPLIAKLELDVAGVESDVLEATCAVEFASGEANDCGPFLLLADG